MTSSSSWSRHHQYGEPQNKKHKQKRSTGIPLSIDSWTNSSVSHPHLIHFKGPCFVMKYGQYTGIVYIFILHFEKI